MNYIYFHDPIERILFRHSSLPEVVDERPGGKLVGWKIRLRIDIVRSDNWLDLSGRWHFATFEYPDQYFDSSQYSREIAQSNFMERNFAARRSACSEEIDKARYDQLKGTYEASAYANRRKSE